MRSALLATALCACAAMPAGAAEVTPQRAAELENLVLQDCGSCHGLTRKGGLGPDLRPQSLEGKSVDYLVEVVLDGVPGTAMPPWHPLLSEAEARWIADYLLKGGTE